MINKHDTEKSLDETNVGISEFVGDHIGFLATIKEKYSDFIVNEIDQNKNIVNLDCDEIPESSIIKTIVESPFDLETEDVFKHMELDNSHSDYIIKLDKNDSKTKRKQIHEYVRQNYPKLITRTEDITAENGEDPFLQKCIIVTQKNKEQMVNVRNTSYDDKGLPKYLHFVLYKEGIDTIQAVNKIGRLLHLKTSRFSYAGTKDKRALTTQRMAVFKVEASRLQDLNRLAPGASRPSKAPQDDKGAVEMGKLRVGNFTYSDEPIRLGSLTGNRFRLILRNVAFHVPLEPCVSPLRTLSRCFDSLRTSGFVNYFGHQRFGSSLDTWRVGHALLSGDWAGALDLILRPPDFTRRATPELRHLLSVWAKTKDPAVTLESVDYSTFGLLAHPPVPLGPELPTPDPSTELANDGAELKSLNGGGGRLNFAKLVDTPEYKLILALAKYGRSDPLKVIATALHRNLRLMYVHSYQSYVWNRVASALLKSRRTPGPPPPTQTTPGSHSPVTGLFGLEVGDLVRRNKYTKVTSHGHMCEPDLGGNLAKKFKADPSLQETEDEASNRDKENEDKPPVDGVAAGEPQRIGDDQRYKDRFCDVEYVTADNMSNFTVYDLVLPLPGYDVMYPLSQDCATLYKDILESDGLKYDEMKRKVKDYSLPGDYRRFLALPLDLRWTLLNGEDVEENVDFIKNIQVEFSLPPSCYATILLRELTKRTCLEMATF